MTTGFQLSPQQAQAWRDQPADAPSVCGLAARVDGVFDVDACIAAAEQAASTCEILRTVFRHVAGMTVPLQVILDKPSSSWIERERLPIDAAAPDAATLRRWLQERAAAGFDFSRGPLVRCAIVERVPDECIILIWASALCADLPTLWTLLDAMIAGGTTAPASRGTVPASGSSEPVQYADVASWCSEVLQSEDGLAAQRRHASASAWYESAPLPFEPATAIAPAQPATVAWSVPPALVARIEADASARGYSLRSALAVCWWLTLRLHTQTGRPPMIPAFHGRAAADLRDALGPLTRFLALAFELPVDCRFAQAALRMEHALAALAEDQECLPPFVPQADAALPFTFDCIDVGPAACQETHVAIDAALGFTPASRLGLLALRQGERLLLTLAHHPGACDHATAAAIAGTMREAIERLAASPDASVDAIELLDLDERRVVLEQWNDTARSLPSVASVLALFEAHAVEHPAQTAVEDEDRTITFGELNARADALAARLFASDVRRRIVALALGRSIEHAIAVLAVWKSGAAWMPLDLALPAAQLRRAIASCDVTLGLVTARTRHQVAACGIPCIEVDAGAVLEPTTASATGARRSIAGDDLAYVIHTSGSTGEPKGVMIAHRALVNLLTALRTTVYAEATARVRVGVNAPLFFDASVKQIVQLAAGHTVCLVPEEIRRDPAGFLALLSERRVDAIDITPRHLQALLDAGLASHPYPSLVLVGGEQIDRELWRAMQADTARVYWNVYGPTECCVDATVARCTPDRADAAIGLPLANTRCYVLDARMRPVPAGAIGELCIGGAGVGHGYYGKARLTAESFVPDPFGPAGARLYRTGDFARADRDGVLHFAGRRDGQVKINGHRVELGAIEAAVSSHPGVRHAAVVQHGEPAQLVAFVEPDPAWTATVDGHPRHVLPNGLAVVQENLSETEAVYREIFEEQVYLRHGIWLPHDACVLDVGANLGLFTLFVEQHCRAPRIWACEPIAPIRAALRQNVGRYKTNVRVLDHGVGATDTVETFVYYPRNWAWSGLRSYANPGEARDSARQLFASRGAGAAAAQVDDLFEWQMQESPIRTLRTIFREEGIQKVDLLKIDVQGAELDVLNGLDPADWDRIEQIVIEAHGENATAVRDLIASIAPSFVLHVDAADPSHSIVYATRPRMLARRPAQPDDWRRPMGVLTERGVLTHVEQQLPPYMLPSMVVLLDRLPLTRTGKIDRRALPALDQVRRAQEASELPRTGAEELIERIWAEVLGRPAVGTDQDFFALGGHSLLATQVMARVRDRCRVELSLRVLFEAPTIRALARKVESAWRRGAGAPEAPALVRRERPALVPPSFAQQRLWFLEQLYPGDGQYHVPLAVRCRGSLDRDALARSLTEIVRRHEVLRTVLPMREGGPVQVFQPATVVPLPLIDLRDWPAGGRERELRRLMTAAAAEPFDLASGPLMRGQLVRLASDEHVLQITLHHIVADAWSLGVLARECEALYTAYRAGRPSPLEELPLQYADYAMWQREWLQGDVLEGRLAYWRTQLRDAVPAELPTDYPRSTTTGRDAATHRLSIPGALINDVRALARAEGATVFMTLVAAWQALVGRITGQTDLVVGTPIANRSRVEIEGLIGFFVNALALRSDLSGRPSFRALLQQVRRTTLEAYAHQDVPIEKVVEAIQPARANSLSPLFQVMFAWQNAPLEPLRLGGLEVEALDVDATGAKFDLVITVSDADGAAAMVIEYPRTLFDARTIEGLGERYLRLLEAAVRSPDTRVAALPLVSPDERARVLASANALASPGAPTVVELFEAHAIRTPERVAVVDEQGPLSYGDLNARSDRVAGELLRRGVRSDTRVGLCIEPSSALLVGLLGILKAGAAYVPVDPSVPGERTAFVFEDAGVSLVVTQPHLAPRCEGPGRTTLIVDDASAVDVPAAAPARPRLQASAAAYVIYTSGSTGRPKGVVVTHHNVARLFTVTAPLMRFTEQDVWTLFHSAAFDFSVWEIWGALAYGGRVVVVPQLVRRSPDAFYDLLVRERVTVLSQTPSALYALSDVDAHRREALDVRLVVLGGEALDVQRLSGWLDRHPPASTALVNMYGITETTVHVTYMPVQSSAAKPGVSAIGRPLADLQTYVLADGGDLAPVGIAGEIFVGGAGVARGYLNRAGLTATRFLPDPFSAMPGARLYRTGDLGRWQADGTLEYLGRLDDQVKIRGFRIEPGEVASVLRTHPDVRDAVVVPHGEGAATHLVAYWTARDEHANNGPDEGTLRAFLARQLPEHMVPAAWQRLAALPLTPNGKVDRRALPPPDVSRRALTSERVAPRTVLEQRLSGIWSELLGVDAIGIHDSFFELGGHSLRAIELVTKLRERLAMDIPVRTIFEAPTIAALAERLGGEPHRLDRTPPLTRRERPALVPLSFAQERLWFLEQLHPGDGRYHVPLAVHVRGTLDPEALAHGLSEIVRRHEVLRTVLPLRDGGPVQDIQPAAPVPLPIIDVRLEDGDDRGEVLRRMLTAGAAEPFDLATGPLVRARLLRLAPDDHVLQVTLHHLVADAWSLGVLVREWQTLYTAYRAKAPCPLPELPVQYADFALWQREWLQGDVFERHLAYWRGQLAGVEALRLPPGGDISAAEQGSARIQCAIALDRSLADALTRACEREQVTPFVVILAALALLLHRYTGQEDIAIGAAALDQRRAVLADSIGVYLDMLVMRTDLSGEPSVRELLRRVNIVVSGALAHQDVPLQRIVDEIAPARSRDHAGLARCAIFFDNTTPVPLHFDEARVEPLEVQAPGSPFDLVLSVRHAADVLSAAFIARSAVISADALAEMASDFAHLLEHALADLDRRVLDEQLLAPRAAAPSAERALASDARQMFAY